jgi:hypothetical protein
MSELMNLEDEELAREKWYREHYEEVYAASGHPYEDFEEAYNYGYSVGQEWDELDYDWDAVRSEAQRGWEALYDRPWLDVREAVWEGWRRGSGRR